MSADNFVGVRPNKNGTWSVFEYGNASVDEEDCMYLSDQLGVVVDSREKALVIAHDLVNEMYVCEYGVVEMSPIPDEPCGRCYICIHDRNIVDPTVERCDGCGEPFHQSQSMTGVSGKWYHNRCEPGRN